MNNLATLVPYTHEARGNIQSIAWFLLLILAVVALTLYLDYRKDKKDGKE